MCSVYLTLALATFCIVAAQVNFPEESNTQEDNNSNNRNNNNNAQPVDVDAQLFHFFRQSHGNTPSSPVGPDQTFFNSIVNPSFGAGGIPLFESEVNPSFGSEVNPSFGSEVNPSFGSEVNPSFGSEVNPSFGSGGAGPPSPLVTAAPPLNPNCQDNHQQCPGWAQNGECTNNIDYMAPHCKRSCGHCENPDPDCVNNNDYCTAWQIRGQCQSNPDYMNDNCKAACKTCGRTSLPAGLRRHSGAKPPGILATDASPPGLSSN